MSLSGAYFAFFAIVGLVVPYLSVYLDRLGYDSESIGIALALVSIMRIIAPSLWSALADRTGQHVLIARIGIFLALLCLLLLFWIESRTQRLIALAAFNFFWTAILPQIEVISLRRLASKEGLYAKVRSAGSIGFIVIATFAGVAIADYGAQAFVAIGALLSLLLFAILLLIKQPEAPQKSVSQDAGGSRFLSWPLIGLVGCAFLIQSSHGAYYTFFILHMNDLGYSSFMAGCLSALGVVAEVALFWGIGYCFARWSLLGILRLALVLTVVRWLLMAYFSDVWPLLLTSLLLHAASFGMVHACSMRWLHSNVDAQHQSKAQALYSGMGFGAGSVVGAALVAPLWAQGEGATVSYVACATLALAAVVLFQFTLAKPSKQSA
nr:MFS transporter [Echinimonas agarilytica]